MRALEQFEIESGAATGLELMERAGQGVVKAVMEEWPDFDKKPHTALVLCGPGNNGGDGFVIARLLNGAGWTVRVHFYGAADQLPADAKANHDLWLTLGEVRPFDVEAIFSGVRPDLLVDAVFGIGLTRPLPDIVATVLNVAEQKRWKNGHKVKRVAVDCPSGLNLDTGYVEGDLEAVIESGDPWPQTLNTADLTVTFHAPKLGHYLAIGPSVCKKLKTVDIGLGAQAVERAMIGQPPDAERARLVEPAFASSALPHKMWLSNVMAKPHLPGHKYDFGHVVVFSGGVGKGGAARLAARAALRVGAGLVSVLCPPAALIENAARLDAIMLRSLKKGQPLSEVADRRVSGFCLGPGMGISGQTRELIAEVLGRRAGKYDLRDPVVVLDADALSCFADNPRDLFDQVHARTILTPHEGEFERLFPDLCGPARAKMSKVEAVRQASRRAGCVILLKGPDTVIAEPNGGASVHAALYDREVPWLATAGAGDVLAGMITGLAAAQTSGDLFCVAELAAYLHVECARSFGPGLIAEDLSEELPKVFRQLGL